MMRRYLCVGVLLVCCIVCQAAQPDRLPTDFHPTADFYQGWQLAVHARTYQGATFLRTLETAGWLGAHWVVVWSGQQITMGDDTAVMHHTMPAAMRQRIKRQATDAGVHLAGYDAGVIDGGYDQWRQVFAFCQDMGIETLIAAPSTEQMDTVERLCRQYGVKLAIPYPDKAEKDHSAGAVPASIADRGPLIGVALDVGALARCGVKPAEAVALLQDRIIAVSMSDVEAFGRENASNVVWGQGQAGVKDVLKALHTQGFKGLVMIDHRHDGAGDLSDRSVDFYEKIAVELDPNGWRSLFNRDLSNAQYPSNQWAFRDRVLTGRASKMWTREQYTDFILDLQWRSLDGANSNSGVFLRTEDLSNPIRTGIEIQIEEYYTWQLRPIHKSGAIYGVVPALQGVQKPAGQWNRFTITWKGSMLYVVFNGRQVAMMDASEYDAPHPMFDKLIKEFDTGHIGLQYHGGTIWFRHIRIKPL